MMITWHFSAAGTSAATYLRKDIHIMLNIKTHCLFLVLTALVLAGCHGTAARDGRAATPPYDRPFALGQVTDAHTDTQETNAEAFKFIMYDHEFRESETRGGTKTTTLTPDGKKHLTQIAVRLAQVPFPVVIEETESHQVNDLRRANVVRWICAFHEIPEGDPQREMIEGRVIIAPAIENGHRAEDLFSGFSATHSVSRSRNDSY